ncbi:MAG: hypothetical protein ACE5EC_07465, partial [Phycisphaerae bacterium]
MPGASVKPTAMRLGYNTNGFAHHRLGDAIEVLSGIGYASVAITLDHYALNPYAEGLRSETHAIRSLLRSRRRNLAGTSDLT